jgi:hypothetical protein
VFLLVGAWTGAGSLGQRIGLSVLATVWSFVPAVGVYTLVKGGTSVNLHERGLALFRRGEPPRTTTWEEIASYTEFNHFRIVKKNGEILVVSDGIDGYIDVGERLQQETLRCLLPPAKAVLAAGGRTMG